MIIRLSPALLILALSGCAYLNANVTDEWDCPAQHGRACATIGEADTLAGAPTATLDAVPEDGATAEEASSQQASPAPAMNGRPAAGTRVRRPEILARVWFYPFVDETNHYHEGGFVHVVMRPADWQTGRQHMFPENVPPGGAPE